MHRTSPALVSTVLAAVVGFGAVGCQTDKVSQVGEKPREAIAYAATAKYPGNAAAEATPAAAAVDASTAVRSTGDAGAVNARPVAPSANADNSSPAVAAPAAMTVGDAPSSSAYRLAVVDRRGEKQIEILNLNDTAIPVSTVWVNGLFVHRLDKAIPPRGTIKVPYANLLEAGRPTGDLRALDQNARKVELQIGDQLHMVEGPAIK